MRGVEVPLPPPPPPPPLLLTLPRLLPDGVLVPLSGRDDEPAPVAWPPAYSTRGEVGSDAGDMGSDEGDSDVSDAAYAASGLNASNRSFEFALDCPFPEWEDTDLLLALFALPLPLASAFAAAVGELMSPRLSPRPRDDADDSRAEA